jgi:oxaloacetate decarboxylase alpha subunit
LAEIPKVREELGFIPLVTPTSQIVGSQAVVNVLMGERYKSITSETAGVLRGEYGATPAPVDPELQRRVLGPGESPITCRPADRLSPELTALTEELQRLASERSIRLAEAVVDDVLTYALFPQVGLKFLAHRDDPSAFEPPPWAETPPAAAPAPVPAASVAPSVERYRVEVDGRSYQVVVSPEGVVEQIAAVPASVPKASPPTGHPIPAPLAGTVVKVKVTSGQTIASGDLLLVLEAMKMETEVRSPEAGTVVEVPVKEGDNLQVGQTMILLG